VIGEEQDWIAKYRAALVTAPARQSRVEALVEDLKGIVQKFAATIRGSLHHTTIVQAVVKPSQEVPCQKVPRVVASRPELQKRVSPRNPRKRHPSGQARRRRAS
jgi:hypothetical protein